MSSFSAGVLESLELARASFTESPISFQT